MLAQGRWQYAVLLMLVPWACLAFTKLEVIGTAALVWPVVLALRHPRYDTIYPPLPQFLPGILWRYIDELLCYGFFVLVLVQCMQHKRPLRLTGFLWAMLLFCLCAFLSMLYNNVDAQPAFLVTSTYMKPWFLFYAVANLPNARRFALRIWNGMIGYGILNIFVVLLQYRHAGTTGDLLFGLARNCNAMAIIMFDIALVLFVGFLLRCDLRKLVVCFIFLIIGLMGSWMVATFSFFLTVVIAVIIVIFALRGGVRYSVRSIILAVIVLAFGIGIALQVDKAFAPVVLGKLERGTQLGMIQAYPTLLKAVSGKPLAGDVGIVACAIIIGSMTVLFWKGIRAYKRWLQQGNYSVTQDIALLGGFGLVMFFHLVVSTLYPWMTLDNPFFMFPQLVILGGLLGQWSVPERESIPQA